MGDDAQDDAPPGDAQDDVRPPVEGNVRPSDAAADGPGGSSTAVESALPGAGAAPRRTLHPLAWFWIYTGLRVVLYAVILGLLWLFEVRGFFGAVVALALTVPLSYVLLARPRAAMVQSINQLRERRTARTDALDEQLQGQSTQQDGARPKNRSQ